MTTISSGTLTQTGSQTYIVGTSSGLDTSALIDTAVAAKTQKADEIDVQIDENVAKIEAYEELQTLAQDLQDSLENLKSVTGYANDSSSIFDARAGYMESSTSVEATSLLSVAVEEGSALGSYDIVVQQKAQAMKVTSDSQSTRTDALGYDGSFSISLDEMSAQDITVTSDMSLDDIADAINATTEDSGISASIIKVGEDSYQMILAGTQTAQDITVSTLSGDDVLNSLGITDAAGEFANVTQQSQSAIITLDGITVTRDDNSFDDLLDGITLDIENADPNTTISLTISNDTDSAKEAITAFIDSYNALREFVVTNQTVASDGSISEDAALFGDSLMKELNNSIANIIASDTNSSLATLRDIGITYSNDNYLQISDETALDDALLDNFEAVQDLFSSTYSSDSDQFALLSNSSTIGSLDMVFDITVDGDGTITSVSVNGEDDMFTISGTRLVGKEGTSYEGLSFSYQGDSSTTINFSLGQGLADRIYNVIDDYANDVTGLFVTEQSELEATNEDLEAEASDIRNAAEAYQEQLIEKYADMEAKIEMLKILQQQIQAILGTSDDDD